MRLNKIPGIGENTTSKLATLNIITVQDLKHTNPKTLTSTLGIGTSKIINLYSAAGIDLSPSQIDKLNKATSNSKIKSKSPSKAKVSIKPSIGDKMTIKKPERLYDVAKMINIVNPIDNLHQERYTFWLNNRTMSLWLNEYVYEERKNKRYDFETTRKFDKLVDWAELAKMDGVELEYEMIEGKNVHIPKKIKEQALREVFSEIEIRVFE